MRPFSPLVRALQRFFFFESSFSFLSLSPLFHISALVVQPVHVPESVDAESAQQDPLGHREEALLSLLVVHAAEKLDQVAAGGKGQPADGDVEEHVAPSLGQAHRGNRGRVVDRALERIDRRHICALPHQKPAVPGRRHQHAARAQRAFLRHKQEERKKERRKERKKKERRKKKEERKKKKENE